MAESPGPIPNKRKPVKLWKKGLWNFSKKAGSKPHIQVSPPAKSRKPVRLFGPNAFHQEPSHSGVEKIDKDGLWSRIASQAGISASSCSHRSYGTARKI